MAKTDKKPSSQKHKIQSSPVKFLNRFFMCFHVPMADKILSRFSFCFLSAALLAGCASLLSGDTIPPPRDALEEAFLLEGRFSLRQGDQNDSGRLTWRHTAAGDELFLASPFGQGLAEIVAVPGQATLTASDGKTFTAPDVPSLTEQALGYRLPLERLTDWVRGHAADAELIEHDTQGRPLRLSFEDWRVEYTYGDDDPRALPVSVFSERFGAFELRLRIDEWSALPGDDDK